MWRSTTSLHMTSKRLVDILVIVGPSGCGKSTLIRRLQREFPSDLAFSVSHTTRPPRVGERDGVDYHFVDKEHFEALIERRAMIEYTWLGEGKGTAQQELNHEYSAYHNKPCRPKDQNARGNYYGTSVQALDAILAQGKMVLMDTDIFGAVKMRRFCEQNMMLCGPRTATPSSCEIKTISSNKIEPNLSPTGGSSETKGVGALRTLCCKVIFIEPPDIATLRARLQARKSESEESLAFRLRLGSEWIRWADMNSELIDHRLVNDDLDRCYAEIKKIFLNGAENLWSSL